MFPRFPGAAGYPGASMVPSAMGNAAAMAVANQIVAATSSIASAAAAGVKNHIIIFLTTKSKQQSHQSSCIMIKSLFITLVHLFHYLSLKCSLCCQCSFITLVQLTSANRIAQIQSQNVPYQQ